MAAALDYKEKGNAAFKVKDYELALANYTTAMKLDPGEFTFPLNRSMVYLKQENWIMAEKDASKVLDLLPGNAKGLFRRGLARKGRKNYEGAREDFTEAMKAGAVEAEKELASLPPPSKSIPSPSLSPSLPPSLPTPDPLPSNIPTSRLRAAISPSSTTTAAIGGGGENDGFMKEVSSRKLTTKSFADKKESRESRLGSSSVVAAAVKRIEVVSSPPPLSPSIPSPSPTTSIPLPLPPPTSTSLPTVTPISRSTAVLTARSASTFEPHTPLLKAPTTALGFESSWNSDPSSRASLLKSLNSLTLPTLFGNNLTPDLLCEIVQELVQPSPTGEEEEYLDWSLSFLRGLVKVPRFSTVVGFLDESEKTALKGIFEKAKKSLESLEKHWEI